MVKARKPKRGKTDEPSRPSAFFLIVSVIGFLILIWWFIYFLPSRATGESEQQGSSAPYRSAMVLS